MVQAAHAGKVTDFSFLEFYLAFKNSEIVKLSVSNQFFNFCVGETVGRKSELIYNLINISLNGVSCAIPGQKFKI